MPATSSYTPTGDADVDGILSGVRWAVTSLTYSFPLSPTDYGTSYGNGEPLNAFKAFTAVQQLAVQSVLKAYEAVSGLHFTPAASGAQGDLRYAESDTPGTAWAYYPSSAATGGDAWFNNSTHWYDSPLTGNYAFLTFLHETGHALGLKHPQDVSGVFGIMPAGQDSLEYTVMSYKSYLGSTASGYTNGGGSYPQGLMMYDIAAVQELYGANYSTNSGDTFYRWNSATGQLSINGVAQAAPIQNKVFMTIWDGGGHDTYDLSGYTTGLTIDLQPGDWSTFSITELADLNAAYAPGTKLAAGNVANALLYHGNTASLIEAVIGGSGSDHMVGNVGDNQFTGGGGNDWIDGLGGVNTAIYTGLSASYAWTLNPDGSVTVSDLRAGTPDGVDTLWHIQSLQFSDISVSTGAVAPQPPANIAPVAANDAYSVTSGSTLKVAAAGVLANDTDANGDHLSAHLVRTTAHGALTFGADGSLNYTPVSGYTGADSFTYTAFDGSLESAQATVTINVSAATRIGRTPKKGAGAADNSDLSHTLSDGHGSDSIFNDQAQAPAQTGVDVNADHGLDRVASVWSDFGLDLAEPWARQGTWIAHGQSDHLLLV